MEENQEITEVKEPTSREKSNANLIPVQPGEVRNPKGKTPGARSIKSIIRQFSKVKMSGKNPLTGLHETLTAKERMVLGQIIQAIEGDTKAFKELVDRLEGKVVDKTETTIKNSDNFDATKLSTEELKTLESLLSKSQRSQE